MATLQVYLQTEFDTLVHEWQYINRYNDVAVPVFGVFALQICNSLIAQAAQFQTQYKIQLNNPLKVYPDLFFYSHNYIVNGKISVSNLIQLQSSILRLQNCLLTLRNVYHTSAPNLDSLCSRILSLSNILGQYLGAHNTISRGKILCDPDRTLFKIGYYSTGIYV